MNGIDGKPGGLGVLFIDPTKLHWKREHVIREPLPIPSLNDVRGHGERQSPQSPRHKTPTMDHETTSRMERTTRTPLQPTTNTRTIKLDRIQTRDKISSFKELGQNGGFARLGGQLGWVHQGLSRNGKSKRTCQSDC